MGLFQRLKEKAKALNAELTAIYLSMRDKRTPLIGKILIVITISYALSPIDLIPDFIPVIGYLDDLIIIPLLLTASIKLIPKDVLAESRNKARENVQINRKIGVYSAIVIILLWAGILTAILFKVLKSKNHF
jgi:uncharacterized membrane protein YkvA (DUF1232 family)